MALFKSAEEKAAKAAEKEQKLLDKYHLSALSDPDDINSVRQIAAELAGSGFMEVGAYLTGNEKDFLKTQMCYQRAIVEQNFIMIRQLDRIVKALESK